MSLVVVYAAATGHVLGAYTSAGPAGDAPAVRELAGDAMPLWAGNTDGQPIALPVPASYLASAAVTDQPGALAVPLAYGIELVNGTPRPDLQSLQPITEGGGPLLPPDGNVRVDVRSDRVTVVLPAVAGAQLPVLLVVAGASGARPVESSTIDAGKSSKDFFMSLPSGTYGTLALVAGWRGVVRRGVVP